MSTFIRRLLGLCVHEFNDIGNQWEECRKCGIIRINGPINKSITFWRIEERTDNGKD